MRKYLFGTGLINAFIMGKPLFDSLRDRDHFTWRSVLAWASWIITVVLAVGAMADIYRAGRGKGIPGDSPIAGQEAELMEKHLRRQ
ncbi:hypothetical protein FHX49_000240 [Microbacterium endophyticum]|uniref:Uncharacterized protein n=1 Tax=Microbacterium endophyticum TaxID=1526412 RepID=A0A7W4V0W1_9MICO|nr:protein BatD [Microbacterium endophyticum]MBB2974699.1 hypothetical protein [Microbacterium endophyticum]NIK36996.1 hypothetical protein [Microbacterium endophyticum]